MFGLIALTAFLGETFENPKYTSWGIMHVTGIVLIPLYFFIPFLGGSILILSYVPRLWRRRAPPE